MLDQRPGRAFVAIARLIFAPPPARPIQRSVRPRTRTVGFAPRSRTDPMALQTLTYVDDSSQLEEALGDLGDVELIGVDVERADGDRYFRTAALIQLGAAGRSVIVDPLALDDLAAVNAFLAQRRVVLHAMENDLAPLATRGVVPARLEDTAVAAELLGLPTGLETLLSQLLGVETPGDKHAMQRADWEARPLSRAMLAYAASDVVDLPRLWDELAARLAASGRSAWYAEELAARQARPALEDRRDWRRVRGAERLDPHARARLRRAWQARERHARETDTAPGRLAGDRVLLDLAERPPSSPAELPSRGMRRGVVRRFGGELITALATTERLDEEREAGRGPTEADRAAADRLRAIRSERAAELELDPGVLCPNRTLLSAVMARPATPEALRQALGLRAWQWAQVGPAFCESLGLTVPGA